MSHTLAATLLLSLSTPSASASPLDGAWQQLLDDPPARAVRLTDRLSARADRLVDELDPTTLQVTGDHDVVISGGGNLGGFYLGMSMVLSRVEAGPADFSLARFAGASAGGMLPYELELKGERLTLEHHISYGMLTEANRYLYQWMPIAAYLQDQHWRLMARWQTDTYAGQLSGLDDTVFLATSCFTPLPTLVMIDHYEAADDQASKAFMATGTMVQDYDGMLCTDGGLMSGPHMTPLFEDGARDQIVVNLMETGFPAPLVWRLRLDPWLRLVMAGQDAAVEFLEIGATSHVPLVTLCPAGATIVAHVCQAP